MPSGLKYLSFNVIKYSIKLERQTKLNKMHIKILNLLIYFN